MIFEFNELASAVIFFDNKGEIETEMNIAEFQAVLDGFVPLEQVANSTARAVYIEFNNQYLIKKLVFFLLPVGKSGAVERHWHMPLLDMANSGSDSKDLGAGPVKLSCRSYCSSDYIKSSLWDPDLTPSASHLTKIKKSILANRLGVQFKDEVEESTSISAKDLVKIEQEVSARLRKEYAQEFRDHMAQLLKEQRLRIATMKAEYQQDQLETKRLHDLRIHEYQELISNKDRLISDQKTINCSLKETVDGQAQKIEAMREYFDRKLASPDIEDSAEDLKSTIEAELSARFTAESKELKEQLQMREVELLYRNELEVQLHDEIARLREENQKAVTNTGEQLLAKLLESGISLVAYHPGAGHITVPLNEVAAYLESPLSYAAEKCGVKRDRYEAWLSHYRMPVCQNTLDEGKMCGENIERVESPIDFSVGESDCCKTCRKSKARAHLRLAGA